MDVNVPPVMVVYASALEVFRNRGRLQFKCSAVKCLPVDPTLEEDAVVAVVVEEIKEKSSARNVLYYVNKLLQIMYFVANNLTSALVKVSVARISS